MQLDNELEKKLKGTPKQQGGSLKGLNGSSHSSSNNQFNQTQNYSRSKKGTIASINFQRVTAGSFLHNDRTIKPNYLIDDISRNEFDLNATQAKEKLSNLYEEAKTNFYKTYSQKLQAKSYLWEAVVNLKSTHKLSDVQNLVKELEKETKFTSIQISVHRDEGHINERNVKEYNNHAHIVFFTLDRKTGQQLYRKSVSKSDKDKGIDYPVMNRDRLRKLQDITAECLQMQRGVSVEITKRKRLSHKQYKEQQKALEESRGKYKEVIFHQQAKLKDLKQLMKLERVNLQEQNATRGDYAQLEQLNKDLQEQIRTKDLTVNEMKSIVQDKMQTITYQNEIIDDKNQTISRQKESLKAFEEKEYKQELFADGSIPRKIVKIKDGLLGSKKEYIFETEAVKKYIQDTKIKEEEYQSKIDTLSKENMVLKDKNLELEKFKVFTKNYFNSSNLNKVREVIKNSIPQADSSNKLNCNIKRDLYR